MSEVKSFSIKKYLVKTNMICIFFFKCCSTIRSINVNPNFFKITKVSLSNPGLQLWLTFCVRNYVIVFFHHHQELKPRPLSQNVLKFLEMSTNNVLQKSSQILRSLSSREYCWVCCCFFHRKYSVQDGWSSSQAKQSSFVRQNFLTNIRHSGSFAIASTPVCEHKKTIT